VLRVAFTGNFELRILRCCSRNFFGSKLPGERYAEHAETLGSHGGRAGGDEYIIALCRSRSSLSS